jgi:heat shock protein HtpX
MSKPPDLFPTDGALVARMLGAAVGTLFLVVGLLALVVLVSIAVPRLAPLVVIAAFAIAIELYLLKDQRDGASSVGELAPAEAPALHAALERLCVAADLSKPRLMLADEPHPNSWTVATRPDRARLHLTRGLIDRLEPRELEAVMAHELSHLAHRDALVMTIVGGPSAALLRGGSAVTEHWFRLAQLGGYVARAIGWVTSFGSLAFSRYREFTADAGAAVLIGSPATVAAALLKVSDGVRILPSRDLRAAAARDAFHLMPVRRDSGLSATHPPLAARITRLERMEAHLQAARSAASGQS